MDARTPIATDGTNDLVGCPNQSCFEGREHLPCTDPDCMACDGAEQTCPACSGSALVRRSFADLYGADRFARANEPGWDGDDRSHNGVTLFSMAMWFRRRESFGRVTRAYGYVFHREPRVVLVNDRGQTITFHGLSWGYGGEGPRGLAAILSDALPAQFPTKAAALRHVSREIALDQEWQVSA